MIFAALATPLFGKIALHGNKVWHRKFYNDFEHRVLNIRYPQIVSVGTTVFADIPFLAIQLEHEKV